MSGPVLEVADPSVWEEIEAVLDLPPLVSRELGPCQRLLRPGAERVVEPALRARGLPILRRRPRPPPERAPRPVPTLGPEALALLHRCQRRAPRGVVFGARAWHPVDDRAALEELVRAGALEPLDPGVPSPLGAFRLREDLPPPPEPPWELGEALFDAPDDLAPPPMGLGAALSDAAALAAALRHTAPRRTHQGHLDKASCRRLGRRLPDPGVARTGDLAAGDPRWRRALDLLEGLGLVSVEPLQRTLTVDEGALERAFAGAPADVLDRTLRRLCPPELRAVLPPLRAALAQAGDAAVDDVLLVELLSEQQGGAWTPDAARFVEEEGPLVHEALRLLHQLGLVRRAPGAFAATEDGRLWAGAPPSRPPVWAGSDLELVIPPQAVGPLDRYALELLAAPLGRDVVDRLRLDRRGLALWLEGHDVDEALALLRRLTPGVPPTLEETVRAWADWITRIVLSPSDPWEGAPDA